MDPGADLAVASLERSQETKRRILAVNDRMNRGRGRE